MGTARVPAMLEPDCMIPVDMTGIKDRTAPTFADAALCNIEARRMAANDAEAVVKCRTADPPHAL